MPRPLSERVIGLLEDSDELSDLHWASTIAHRLGVTTRAATSALNHLKRRGRVNSVPCAKSPNVWCLSETEIERYLYPHVERHCQNGCADVCRAAQRDGIICPDDSCDIDDEVRPKDPPC
ncbi:DNA binding protein [Stenotrophomonas phage Sonora]|nr:DNA binding protein [Stenotrophomonas phage Sonora]